MSSRKIPRKSQHEAPASPEIQAIIDGYAERPDAPPDAGLKKALGGFPSWLPHLTRRLQSGPAPFRKAALRILRESGTQSAADAVQATVADPVCPAWLRLAALRLDRAVEGGAPQIVSPELRAEIEQLESGAEGLDAASRIELLIDAGDWEALSARFGQDAAEDEAMIAALVEHETPAAGQFLLRLKGRCTTAAQEKGVRKALFTLRQRGLALEEPAARPEAPVLAAAPETHAFASHIDGDGARLLLIARARSQDSGMDFLQFMLHEEKGIVSFSRGWLPRREVKSVVEEIQGRDERVKLVALDAAWGWHLLREAFAASRRSSTEVPEQFVRERHLWEIPEPPGGLRNPVLAGIAGSELDATDAARVAEEPELLGWGPERKVLAPYVERYRDLESSPVMISPELKASRLDEEIARGSAEYFDETRRKRLARRLEEMAGYFASRDRNEAARRALAAGRGLGGTEGAEHPLLRAIWRSSLLDEIEALKHASAVAEPSPQEP